MEEITFSIFNHGQAALGGLQALLREFERQHKIHVHLDMIPTWSIGWTRLVQAAIYHNGPDVSEVGNTWTGDFARMEALRPFESEEIGRISQGGQYIENVWVGGSRNENNSGEIFAIPWSGDTRVVFYYRDILEKAGIDEAGAFKDFDRFEQTLAKLQAQSSAIPLTLPTRHSHLTIHNIASWVWGAGGDFLTPDGTGLAFTTPEAMEGCKRYFRLRRFLSAEDHGMEESQSNDEFWSGKAAVSLTGYWVLSDENTTPEVRGRLGAAPAPGVPFVGGHDLVVWNHTSHPAASLELIRFLHSDEVGRVIYPSCGLPISENGWANPPFDSGLFPVFKEALQKGRGFKGRLWGMLEKRLADVYADIWEEIIRQPEERLDIIIETHLNELARHMQLSMGA
ncbi:MAG TPA: extracellular solute-binding protein [Anaerolineales bacterium]|nr:extracellular solute-binding protein [Anaerolineales bacterium]